MTSFRGQILRNLTSNIMLGVARIVLGFLLVPFLIGKLGIEAYGLLALSELVIFSFEIFTVSVRQSLSRHATYALSQGDRDAFIEYLSTGRVILLASAAIVLVVGSLISVVFDTVFRVPAHLVTHCKIFFFLITLAFSASIANIAYWTVLYAKQRFDLINTAEMAAAVMRAAAVFVLFSVLPVSYQTLVTYGFVYWAMILAQNFTVVAMQRRVMPDVRMTHKHFRREHVKSLLTLSLHASITRLSQIFVLTGTNFFINRFWGPSMNAVYSIATRFPAHLQRFFVEPTWSLTSTFTDLVARQDRKRLEKLFYFYSKAMLVLSIPISLGLVVWSGPIIQLWVGPNFELAGRLMPFYIIPLWWTVPFAVMGCITYAYGCLKIPARVSLAQAVLSLSLGVYWGYVKGGELFGFAGAHIVVGFITSTLFGIQYSCHIASLSVRRYWKEVFLGPGLLALLVFGGWWALCRAWNLPPLLEAPYLIFYGIIAMLFYGASFFTLFTDEERRDISQIAGTIFLRTVKPAADRGALK